MLLHIAGVSVRRMGFVRAMVLLSWWAGCGEAALVLDQSFLGLSQLSGGVGAGHYGAPTLTQTFTVGVNGTLSEVALPLYRLNLPSVVTVNIYITASGVPAGVRMGSVSMDAANLPEWIYNSPVLESDLTRFAFGSQGIAVEAGEQFAFQLSSTEVVPGASGVGVFGGIGYGGGMLTYDIGNGPVPEAPYSLFFETYTEVPVAEPGVAGLVGAALLGLAAVRRNRCRSGR